MHAIFQLHKSVVIFIILKILKNKNKIKKNAFFFINYINYTFFFFFLFFFFFIIDLIYFKFVITT